MELLNSQQIKNIHDRLLPEFNLASGNFNSKVDAILELAPEINRLDLRCIMNPNFDEIHRKYKFDSDYIKILREYGQCIQNKFIKGQPEDPITYVKIKPGNVVIIEGYGYDKTTASKMLSINMRNPMTNESMNDNQIDRIERESAITDHEMLNAMYGNSDDEEESDDDEEDDDEESDEEDDEEEEESDDEDRYY